MTTAQHRLYLRLWQEALAAAFRRDCNLGWLLTEQSVGEQPAEAVFQAALSDSVNSVRGISAERLRHACTLVAIGQHKSSKVLTNAEANRVFACLRLLKNPLDLSARADWDDMDRARHRGLIQALSAYADAYIQSIARDKFALADWRLLTTRQLAQLLVTLKNRTPH